MNTLRLIQAIACIQQLLPPKAIITAIEFEDGSGNKFNYTVLLYNASATHFIDLTGKL